MSGFASGIDDLGYEPVYFSSDCPAYGDSEDTAEKVNELSSCIGDYQKQNVMESLGPPMEKIESGSVDFFPKYEVKELSSGPETKVFCPPPARKPRTVRPVWPLAEIRILKELKEKRKSWKEISKSIVNRSPDDCSREWVRLVSYDFWTREERNYILSLSLTENSSDASFQMAAENLKLKRISLTEKTAADCRTMLLGAKGLRWTSEAMLTFKKVAETAHSLQEISKRTNRSIPMCKRAMRKLGLKYPVDFSLEQFTLGHRKVTAWTGEEDLKLINAVRERDERGDEGWAQIAFGSRSAASCACRFNRLKKTEADSDGSST